MNKRRRGRPRKNVLVLPHLSEWEEVSQSGTPATEVMDYIQKTLNERSSTHGEFTDHALYTQSFKRICRQSKNWDSLTDIQQEALDMIVHKIARVLGGDPNHKDHWHDIAGYAQLVEERL